MLKDGKNEMTVVSSLPPKSRLLVTLVTLASASTGTFVAGETVTGGSSKKTAVIDTVESTTRFVIHTDGGLTTGEGLTGGTSGATGTMSGVPTAYGHNGSQADLNGYNSATVVFSAGAIGETTTATPTLEESSDGTTWTSVASTRINGTLANLTASSTLSVGVDEVGGLQKRYLRPVVTIAGANPVLCSAYVLRSKAVSEPAGSTTSVLIG